VEITESDKQEVIIMNSSSESQEAALSRPGRLGAILHKWKCIQKISRIGSIASNCHCQPATTSTYDHQSEKVVLWGAGI
jgi:hypothetical protein